MLIRKPARDGLKLGSDRIGNREVDCWSATILAVAFWANIVRGTSPGDLPNLEPMIGRVLDNGAFDVFAWILVFARVTSMSEAGPASWLRIWATFLAGIIALAPVRLGAGVALVILGGLLLSDRRTLPAGRQVGLLFLVLSFETVWTSPILTQLHGLSGRLDAKVCAFLLTRLNTEAITHGNVVENLSTSFNIVIFPFCTSSFQLASASVAFLVMILYFGQSPRPRHIPWLGISLIGSILLTEIRLMLMASGQANYVWWHDGPGTSLYVLAALALAVWVPFLATREARAAEALPGNRYVA